MGHGDTVQIAPGIFKLVGLLPLTELQKLRSSATTWLETCLNSAYLSMEAFCGGLNGWGWVADGQSTFVPD